MKSRQTLLDEIERDALDESASVAAALRKCLALGGHVHSTALRQWAQGELKGYEPGSTDIPAYRTVPAALMADWRAPGWQAKGDVWSTWQLPDFARDDIKEEMTFYHGVGEIEAMLRRGLDNGGTLDFGFQGASDLAAYMSSTGDRYTSVDRLYHQVSVVAIAGLLDQVRTTLTSLVAELRDSPLDQRGLPTEAAATQAVHVAVSGKRNRVLVSAAQNAPDGSAVEPEPWWKKWQVVSALVAGLATLTSAGFFGGQRLGLF